MDGQKRDSVRLGVHLSRHLQVLVASFPDRFWPDQMAELKWDCFYGGLPKLLKPMVAYLKATPGEKTYSDYLHGAWEAEKEEAMEPSCAHTVDSMGKPKMTSFFPLRKLKETQPTKTPAVWLAHLEEEAADDEEGTESEDPYDLDGMTEEFIVCLARAVKDTQQEEKCCYHCSSLEHFIRDCPLVKSATTELHLNCKEGMALKKGAWTPLVKVTLPKASLDRMPKL